jgi:hypothetical protein
MSAALVSVPPALDQPVPDKPVADKPVANKEPLMINLPNFVYA